MLSEVRFFTHAYGENSVGRVESILFAPQVPRRRLVITNGGDENFAYKYHGNNTKKKVSRINYNLKPSIYKFLV
jgi:hypothetical protein